MYKDIIPGYRIRQLTALEEAEKVRDEIKRQREGEKLLVNTYKGYLKALEAEIKARSTLASLCLKCMSELLVAVPHFNFAENIMGVLVGRVCRKSWDDDAELVFNTFVSVFKADLSAQHSQTLVRLIARMMKERKFQVNPKILGCLLHLRLIHELDPKRETKKKDDQGTKVKAKFKSDVREKWRTKNQKKKDKEMKEIRKEMAEAEAEVNEEERAQVVSCRWCSSLTSSKPKLSKTSSSSTFPYSNTRHQHLFSRPPSKGSLNSRITSTLTFSATSS